MHNKDLAKDYLARAENRLAALEVLMKRKSYPDVVREAQEIVELCLKSLLRSSGVEPPRSHDVSSVLEETVQQLPLSVRPQVPAMAKISKKMRRDRELSFYGSEDLTPLEFYKEEDAKEAFDDAKWIFSVCQSGK